MGKVELKAYGIKLQGEPVLLPPGQHYRPLSIEFSLSLATIARAGLASSIAPAAHALLGPS